MPRLTVASITTLAVAGYVVALAAGAAGSTAATSCPAARPPGTNALAVVMRLAPQLVRTAYRDVPLRDYSLDGAASLNAGSMSARELPGLVRIASKLCGPVVASRTVLLFLSFPAARSINTGESVAFVARTAHGWVVWHRYFPIP